MANHYVFDFYESETGTYVESTYDSESWKTRKISLENALDIDITVKRRTVDENEYDEAVRKGVIMSHKYDISVALEQNLLTLLRKNYDERSEGVPTEHLFEIRDRIVDGTIKNLLTYV